MDGTPPAMAMMLCPRRAQKCECVLVRKCECARALSPCSHFALLHLVSPHKKCDVRTCHAPCEMLLVLEHIRILCFGDVPIASLVLEPIRTFAPALRTNGHCGDTLVVVVCWAGSCAGGRSSKCCDSGSSHSNSTSLALACTCSCDIDSNSCSSSKS